MTPLADLARFTTTDGPFLQLPSRGAEVRDRFLFLADGAVNCPLLRHAGETHELYRTGVSRAQIFS